MDVEAVSKIVDAGVPVASNQVRGRARNARRPAPGAGLIARALPRPAGRRGALTGDRRRSRGARPTPPLSVLSQTFSVLSQTRRSSSACWTAGRSTGWSRCARAPPRRPRRAPRAAPKRPQRAPKAPLKRPRRAAGRLAHRRTRDGARGARPRCSTSYIYGSRPAQRRASGAPAGRKSPSRSAPTPKRPHAHASNPPPPSAKPQYCGERGIKLLTYGSVGGGLLSDKYVEEPRKGLFGAAKFRWVRTKGCNSKDATAKLQQQAGGGRGCSLGRPNSGVWEVTAARCCLLGLLVATKPGAPRTRSGARRLALLLGASGRHHKRNGLPFAPRSARRPTDRHKSNRPALLAATWTSAPAASRCTANTWTLCATLA